MDSKTSTTTAPLPNANAITEPEKSNQSTVEAEAKGLSKPPRSLPLYLAKRDGVDKLLRISRYATKIVLASSGLPETLPLTQWLKSFESSAGVSHKAFRLGKFVQDVNAVRSSKFDLNQELLTLIAYGGEGLYLVHVFIQSAYAYSKQTYRGRGDARTNGTVSQLLQTGSRGSSRTPIIQEGSKQIVSYGRGGRSSELMGDFSMALAFALENGGKLGRMDTSSTSSMLGFLNQIGRGTVESSLINSNE